MADLIATLLSGGTSWLIGAGGIVALVLGIFFKGRSSGKAAEKAQQAEARLRSITEAQKVEDAIAGRLPDENRKRLSKWSRQ
jgi:hypothetical protein